MRVLCVGLGNLCRAPAAQGVLREMNPDWTVASAATCPVHLGQAPFVAMQQAARAAGYDISDHTAQEFRISDFDRFDAIYAMDRTTQEQIEFRRPAGNRTHVALFADDDIHDPYLRGQFGAVMDQIIKAAAAISGDRIARLHG